MQATLVYRMEVVDVGFDPDGSLITAPVIRWEGVVDLTAQDALDATKATKAGHSNAQDFLSGICANGPVQQKLIVERGIERGFNSEQLRRAKEKLGIKAFRPKGVKDSGWLWAFPRDAPQDAEE
jgi:hypothetical protein